MVAFWAVLQETFASASLGVPLIKFAETSLWIAFPLASLCVKRVSYVIIVCRKELKFALLCQLIKVSLKSID